MDHIFFLPLVSLHWLGFLVQCGIEVVTAIISVWGDCTAFFPSTPHQLQEEAEENQDSCSQAPVAPGGLATESLFSQSPNPSLNNFTQHVRMGPVPSDRQSLSGLLPLKQGGYPSTPGNLHSRGREGACASPEVSWLHGQ